MAAAQWAFRVVLVVVLALVVVWLVLNPENLPIIFQWIWVGICAFFGVVMGNFPSNLIAFAIILFLILWIVRSLRGGAAH